MEYTNSKGINYYLHSLEVVLKNNNGTYRIYYFAKAVNPERAQEALPEGYIVSENNNSKLPLLKKVR